MTREDWLDLAIGKLRPAFEQIDLNLPDVVHVSVGFPSSGGLSRANRVIGECWNSEASLDGNPQVYISPLLSENVKVLETLSHELIHATGISGHRANFKRAAESLGLTGKATCTVAGPEMLAFLTNLSNKLGPYPHPGIEPGDSKLKKQSTRLLKAECANPECSAIIRLTRKVVESPGLPTCACGGEFALDDESLISVLNEPGENESED